MPMGKPSAAGKARLAGGSRALARAGPPPSVTRRKAGAARRQAFPASDEDEDEDEDEEGDSGSEPEEATSRRGSRRPAAASDDDDDGDDGMSEDEADDASDVDGGSDGDDLDAAQAVTDAKLAQLERELANVPFEKLAEIKAKLGLTAARQRRERSGPAAAPPPRGNKHRPQEVSSKKPVSVVRNVVEGGRKKARDPRFDAVSGHFNKDLFEKSYGFVKDLQSQELKELEKEAAKTKDAERKAALQRLLDKRRQKLKQAERERERQERVREFKRRERELVKQGKKPFYLKKSDERKLHLIADYEDLKKKGKLEKVIEKRRQRQASKDHRLMPHDRRDAD